MYFYEVLKYVLLTYYYLVQCVVGEVLIFDIAHIGEVTDFFITVENIFRKISPNTWNEKSVILQKK